MKVLLKLTIRGINYALKNKYDYILLLNNDTRISKNMIENLIMGAVSI